jgi:hypothetical protein
MIFDNNRDGIADYDPITQDLYLYNETNTGNPIAWNPNCVVYQYREYLETRRAKQRIFFNQLAPEPPGSPLSQKPNYWNNQGVGVQSAPYMWVSPSRGLFSSHYWGLGLNDACKRRDIFADQIGGSWATTDFNFLNLNNNLVTLDKSKLRFGWEWVEIVPGGGSWNITNRKSFSDLAIFEYTGTEMQGKKFPKIGNNYDIGKDTFDFYFVIDSQDKVKIIETESIDWPIRKRNSFIPSFPIAAVTVISFSIMGNTIGILGIGSGDSGSQVYGVKNGVVYFICNYDNNTIQIRRDDIPNKKWVVDFTDQVYAQLPFSKMPIPKQIGKKTTIDASLNLINNIKELLT